MTYLFWLLPLVGAYAFTAWMESVLDWRIDFLADKLLDYAMEIGQCEQTT